MCLAISLQNAGVGLASSLWPYVAHYHINDYHGKLDKHLPLGEGIAPWKGILPKMEKNVSVLIEVDSLEKYKKSVAFLENVRKERQE
jgi:sugar phosphate isomerase/epimerase